MSEGRPGHATADGTARAAGKRAGAAPHGYVPFGSTGLTVSRVGFGCYRVDDATADHRRALEAALTAGCNLIDTSTNYTDGASETLVGQVLGGVAERDAVVVVTKIGYVQGQNLHLAGERDRSGAPFPEMVRYSNDCWHCIHPEFLEDQLNRSLARLRLATLDVCLLHNPEYFFSDAKRRRRTDLEALRGEFYRRVREAFAFFESMVREGRIRYYGVSSNTATAPPDDFEATSVSRMLEAAKVAGGLSHHFRVLQIPMNLFESGGALVRNAGPDHGQTALEAAAAAGVGVLVNRPLNAFVAHRLVRLADVLESPGVPRPPDCWKALKELQSGLGDRSGLPIPAAQAVERLFDLADEIVQAPEQVEDMEHWRQIEEMYVRPQLKTLGQILESAPPPGRAAWDDWRGRCHAAMERLIASAGNEVASRGRKGRAALHALIDPALPPDRRGESLSRKAIWAVASTPGVSTVLVGMRREPYVADALGVMAWPPHPDPLSIFRQVESSGRR